MRTISRIRSESLPGIVCLASLALCAALASHVSGTEIANSQTEFSGVQGANGWYHGYRNWTDSGQTDNYNAAEAPSGHFIRFSGGSGVPDAWTLENINANIQHWTGTEWDLSISSAPWTRLGPLIAHPNGGGTSASYPAHSGKHEWAIRRWKADELAAVSPLAVTYTHWNASTSGTGTTLYLAHNGTVVDVWTRNSTTQGSRTFYLNVQPGDYVDVCLGSLGTTGSRSDANDTTNFRFTVNDSLPPVPTQPDGSLFIPANATDTDGDGILDVWEYYYTEPDSLAVLTATGDYDTDGRTDPQEITAGTNPTDADTDDDGLNDGAEFVAGTNPTLADTDGDGLSDGAELNAYGSNPLLADTDGDGLRDGFEVGTLTGLTNPDSDGDGSSDGQEVLLHLTNPLAADTDGDGFGDAQEVASGTRPRDATSFPGSEPLPPQLAATRSGGNIVLSWPAIATNWMLCWSDGLSPADWKLVPEMPVIAGGQQTVSLPISAASRFFQLRHRGAVVPFTTYEAEAATTSGGSVVQMTGAPSATNWTPEMEASGRAFVQLNNTGDRVDFTNIRAANALVIRHCIPDAPTGGGITATLSLYVNGVFRQKLTLTSKFGWLYGEPVINSAWHNNDPTTLTNPTAHAYWDEARAFITGGLQAGDTLRLQKDADDTAGFYRIDLVDLETAPPPLLPPPAGSYLSVADFGADGSDANDDTAAIQSCVTAAKAQGKHVWLPAGTYYQSASITFDGVSFLGAGMWQTALIATPASLNQLRPAGAGPRMADLYLENNAQAARGASGYAVINSGTVTNWIIENVWITHTITGPWMVNSPGGVVRGCRIHNTFADGIHINSSNVLVEHNHIRGAGDDGIALYSETAASALAQTSCTARFNTVIANHFAQNASRGGGTDMVFEDNLLADVSLAAAFSITHSSTYPVHPSVGGSFRRNTILRGGGNASNQKRGAIWIWPGGPTGTSISGVKISDNDIRDSIFRGIHLVGGQNQEITFERNVVDYAGEHGIFIDAIAVGMGIFTNNVVRNINAGFSPFVNSGGSDYTATQSGNSWQ